MNYLSLFSGIGGFEHGIEKSNKNKMLKCIGYSEVDKYAENIYKKQYPNHVGFGDATKIKTEDLPDFELLVGGFPCQAFSVAGKRRGLDDARGTLFFEIARILRDKRPKYFLLENVRGLLSHDGGETIKTFLEILTDIGYYVKWQVLNSKDYGVPQNRERIYIKGYFRETTGAEILSVGRTSPKNNGNITVKPLNNGKQARRVYDVGGLSCTLCANGGGQGGKTGLYKVTEQIKATTTKNGDLYALTTRQRGRPLNKCQDNYIFMNDKVRRLTPVECERLQGFPDGWTQYGADGAEISDTQRYKCLGNAVTTNVIKYIFDNWNLKE